MCVCAACGPLPTSQKWGIEEGSCGNPNFSWQIHSVRWVSLEPSYYRSLCQNGLQQSTHVAKLPILVGFDRVWGNQSYPLVINGRLGLLDFCSPFIVDFPATFDYQRVYPWRCGSSERMKWICFTIPSGKLTQLVKVTIFNR